MDRTNRRGTRRGTTLDSSPPNDFDAERAVVACVLLDPGRIAEVAAALEPADFAGEANRTIYETMLRLHSAGNPVDATLLVGELREAGVSPTVRQRSPRRASAIRPNRRVRRRPDTMSIHSVVHN
jgi:DnaB-like helicase N terminal domain